MPLPEYDEATIRSIASDRAFYRGEEYCEGGCVSKIVTSADSYYANVYGHRRYSVRIWDVGGHLRTSCTCRYGSERVCRHIVAVMFAVLRGDDEHSSFNWYESGTRVDHQVADAGIDRIAAELEQGRQPEAAPEPNESEDAATRRSRVILASEVMKSPVVSISPDADLVDTWKLICERRFRHLPVLSEDGKLVGIVSDRDVLLRAALIAASDSAHVAHPGATIKDIMRTRVLTSNPNTEIRQIARVFFEERIGAMPIVEEGDRVIGMITRSDVLRALIDRDLIWL